MIEMHTEIHIGYHASCPLFMSTLTKTAIWQQMLEKLPNNKFHNKIIRQFSSCYMHTAKHSKTDGLTFLVFVVNAPK
jgi:hypothetical protein